MVSQPHLPVPSFHCYKRPTQTGSCTAANPHTHAFCTYFKLLLPQPSLLKSRSREIPSICPVPISESYFKPNCKGPVRKTSQEGSQAFYLTSGKESHRRVHQMQSRTLGGAQEVWQETPLIQASTEGQGRKGSLLVEFSEPLISCAQACFHKLFNRKHS